jgi:hypothetical protein
MSLKMKIRNIQGILFLEYCTHSKLITLDILQVILFPVNEAVRRFFRYQESQSRKRRRRRWISQEFLPKLNPMKSYNL